MKKVEEKIIRFIDSNNLIYKGEKVLLALSGGPDSVFLLHFLLQFRRRFQITIGVFHLNHSLRGKESDEDQKFVEDLADKNDLTCFLFKKNVKLFAVRNKLSLEEAGRKLRYELLEKITRKESLDKILTAHNADDNAETVLLNLLKGTGVSGLSGIPVKRNNIVRPILCVTKDEILRYLKKNKIEFRTDTSNELSIYQRNFLRNEIFPLLKKHINPDVIDSLFTTSKNISSLKVLVDDQVEQIKREFITTDRKSISISKEILDYKKILISETLKSISFEKLDLELSSDNIEDILKLFSSRRNKEIKLGNNYKAISLRDEIRIQKEDEPTNFVPVKIKIGENKKIKNKRLKIFGCDAVDDSDQNNLNTEYIDQDKLADEMFIVRKWRNGDRFHPLGMKGSKKISDFLNDLKLTLNEKSSQLVLTNNEQIVWVIGKRLDERFRISNRTKRIIKLCLS